MRRFFNGAHACALIVSLGLFVGVLVGGCGSDKSKPVEAKLPPGEHAKVVQTTTTSTTIPQVQFVTISRGEDQTLGAYIWHGTIDGVDCIIYGSHMFCKGYGEK